MPYAVREIRAFSRHGHVVHAADSFRFAPGNGSRHVTKAHETLAPCEDARGYHNQIATIVETYGLDLVVPSFEEVFYLQAHNAMPGEATFPIFAAQFETLEVLHDKGSFASLCETVGLNVAASEICRTSEELIEATRRHDQFFARASYSRAGTDIVTNAGPLANVTPVEDVEPTADNPWLVQPFIEGTDLCSFSIAHEGKIVAHSAYRHPKTLDSAGGIVFESVWHEPALRAAQTIVEATHYTGQISFDFLTTDDGRLYLVECNPRPTAGATVMPSEMLVRAILEPDLQRGPMLAPAGARCSIRSALLRDMVVQPSEIGADLNEIFSDTPDAYFDPEDITPGIYQFLSLAHVIDYWRTRPDEDAGSKKLAAGYLHDITWNGEAMRSEAEPLPITVGSDRLLSA